jgi:hypothetical protein
MVSPKLVLTESEKKLPFYTLSLEILSDKRLIIN